MTVYCYLMVAGCVRLDHIQSVAVITLINSGRSIHADSLETEQLALRSEGGHVLSMIIVLLVWIAVA